MFVCSSARTSDLIFFSVHPAHPSACRVTLDYICPCLYILLDNMRYSGSLAEERWKRQRCISNKNRPGETNLMLLRMHNIYIHIYWGKKNITYVITPLHGVREYDVYATRLYQISGPANIRAE